MEQGGGTPLLHNYRSMNVRPGLADVYLGQRWNGTEPASFRLLHNALQHCGPVLSFFVYTQKHYLVMDTRS